MIGHTVWDLFGVHCFCVLSRVAPYTCIPFTFKAFRAGKATALAAAGKSIGTILRVGERRSSAFLAYVDEDVVDVVQLLSLAVDNSDA